MRLATDGVSGSDPAAGPTSALVVGNRFVVTRCDHVLPPGVRLPILLAHGRAFGSGEHETTRSCLEELERIPVRPATRVLDVGCGTGILAIAAARLGARVVVALDPAPQAMETASAGIRLNGLQEFITPVEGELDAIRHCRFDLVMANLHGDILLELAPAISPLMDAEAYLLLSGIQYEHTYDVKSAFLRAGCRLLRSRYLDEYTTLVFRK